MHSTAIRAAALGVALAVAGTVWAQQPPPRMFGGLTLLLDPTVAPEFKLTAEQIEKSRPFYQAHRTKVQALVASFDGDLTKFQLGFYQLQAEGMTELAAVLTPQQLKRLKQVCWQQGGVHALGYDEELQAHLKVTAEQKERIRKLAGELLMKISETRQSEKISAMRKEYTDKVVATLMAEQQKAYKDLLGQTLPVFSGRKGGKR